MTVITRIAPSPTGYMHIGTARTALFNWLYAKHTGGKFFLRIEDTDRERSTPEATQAIIDGMRWLGLDWEGDAVYQYARGARHADVAHELLKHGKAYKCYTTQAELEEFRRNNPNAKFRSPWRDRHDHPNSVPYVIRLKAPLEGRVTINDQVMGETGVDAAELDDMVLLRSDGSPTYMLAVVVDDHDMGVTHVIRGADHFTNTFRQCLIYEAMGWDIPQFAHIPLIHGADGAKLSKRHGALGVQEYEKMGYLPEAMRNYLLRLGWAHGDDEIISTEQAVEWFDLPAVGKSPARFDLAKLDSLNGHYIREAEDARLLELIVPIVNKQLVACDMNPITEEIKKRLLKGMKGLKQRATTLKILAGASIIYTDFPRLTKDSSSNNVKTLINDNKAMLAQFALHLQAQANWNQVTLEQLCRDYADSAKLKLGAVAQPLRAALTGSTTSPPIFEVMEVLGKEETLGRLRDVC